MRKYIQFGPCDHVKLGPFDHVKLGPFDHVKSFYTRSKPDISSDDSPSARAGSGVGRLVILFPPPFSLEFGVSDISSSARAGAGVRHFVFFLLLYSCNVFSDDSSSARAGAGVGQLVHSPLLLLLLLQLRDELSGS